MSAVGGKTTVQVGREGHVVVTVKMIAVSLRVKKSIVGCLRSTVRGPASGAGGTGGTVGGVAVVGGWSFAAAAVVVGVLLVVVVVGRGGTGVNCVGWNGGVPLIGTAVMFEESTLGVGVPVFVVLGFHVAVVPLRESPVMFLKLSFGIGVAVFGNPAFFQGKGHVKWGVLVFGSWSSCCQ